MQADDRSAAIGHDQGVDLDRRSSEAGAVDEAALLARLQSATLTAAGRAALRQFAPHMQRALAASASAERAILSMERWIESQPDASAALTRLAADQRSLELLLTLFAGSQHLTEILLRHPVYITLLTDRTELWQVKSQADLDQEAHNCIALGLTRPVQADEQATLLACLHAFQQRELLRIGLGDLGGFLDLSSVTLQLSYLAESIVRACLALVSAQTGIDAGGLAVLALGKLGGGELNYSSDIDLLFVADAQSLHYQRLGQKLINALCETAGSGFLYRVDMRLRPWGQVGPLITTLRGHLAYLQQAARLWEKQALLKARVIAGSQATGQAFLEHATPLLFSTEAEQTRSDVHAMKQQTEAWLRQTGHDWGEVKLGEGSIRDIEFVVQYLQLVHGAGHPELRSGNTLQALSRLAEAGLLKAAEYRILIDGYLFLRTVEHYLQILNYQQTHELPTNPTDLRYLARRLGFVGGDSPQRLITRYMQHAAAIRAVYQRHLAPVAALSPASSGEAHPIKDKTGDAMAQKSRPARPTTLTVEDGAPPVPDDVVLDHVARLSSSYTNSFSPDEIRRHAGLAASLTDRNPAEVRAVELDDQRQQVTVVAYDYLGELSIICGLLFAYGFSIMSGQVHTYEPKGNERRKIVDVLDIRLAFPARAGDMRDVWTRYAADLAALLRLLQAGQQREAQGELAKRVAIALPQSSGGVPVLHPIDIEIDNTVSEQYTVLRIDTPDTVGFLYEFANALALQGVHITEVNVKSVGNRVHDTLLVTDAAGRKLAGERRERELRVATVLVKHFTHLLPHSPDPETALQHFHEYLGELFQRPSWPDELTSLEKPEVLSALARLLGVSDFLWDDFLRMQYANLFPVVRDVAGLNQVKAGAELERELAALLKQESEHEERLQALNAFKDREMFRTDMRHILGHITEFGRFSAELTELVEVVVRAACDLCLHELAAEFGAPRSPTGDLIPYSLCVLGKCGGRELGYASDIEVMLVYGGSGATDGQRTITASEYFEKTVVEFMRAIWARHEGIFEIDLDLRPYGKTGSLAVSLDAFRRYFVPGGPAWPYERQALIKLRAIGGDVDLGQTLHKLRDEYVYTGAPLDTAAMRAMRERQLRHLVTPGTFNVKYSLGALVDAEYTVQALQMLHGRLHPELRLTNTRAAIAALVAQGVLPADDGERLSRAHLFLQTLINALRMVRGHSKDLTIPPQGSDEFAFLARRLGYGSDAVRLQDDLTMHAEDVRRLAAQLVV